MKRIEFVNEATLSAAQLNEMQDNTQDAINKINDVIGTDGKSSSSIVARISNLENNLTETEPGSESLEGPTFADRVNNLEIAVGISEGETSLASRVQNLEKEFITTDKGPTNGVPEEGTFADKLKAVMNDVEANSAKIEADSAKIDANKSNIENLEANHKLYLGSLIQLSQQFSQQLAQKCTITPYGESENAIILYGSTDSSKITLKPGQMYLKVTEILE